MHDGVDFLRTQICVEFVQTGVARQRIEHLAGIGDVGDERANRRVVQRLRIQVQDAVAGVDQILHHMAPGLAAAAGKDDTLHAHSFWMEPVLRTGRVRRVRLEVILVDIPSG